MKSNKGITLTSLMIYIIGMMFILSTIATLTSFFRKNIQVDKITTDTTQYTKFSSIFLDEINNKNNTIIECKTTREDNYKTSYIIFSSGNQYTFMEKNNAIYKNNFKICEQVNDCDFSYNYVNSKYQITVNFVTNNISLTGQDAITYNL